MRSGLTVFVGQLLTILLSHSYQELIQAHGGIDSDFSTEEGLDVIGF
jgi:hypothetical protein